jgi:Ser/Thr protein kinase RdoA (MazF antagonist)
MADLLVARFDGADVHELGGGHQSRVFLVTRRDGSAKVAKVLDATMVDRDQLGVRVGVIAALADLEQLVCRPLPIDDRLVNTLSDHYTMVCYEHAEGVAPQVSNTADAAMMGRTLAQLHRSMAQIPPTGLPVVSALRSVSIGAAEPVQLLHGDFNATNLHQHGGIVRVFDFDDCGSGPPAFDVANALYMVLFDATVHDAPDQYWTFRDPFVSAYCDAAGHDIDHALLDHHIDLRVGALSGWLDDPDTAPAGIRTASPVWRATLRSFVAAYRGGPDTTTT